MEDNKASQEDRVILKRRTLPVRCTASVAMYGAAMQMNGARKSLQNPEAMIRPAGPPTRRKIKFAPTVPSQVIGAGIMLPR